MSETAERPPQAAQDSHHSRIGARKLLAFEGFRRLLFSRFSSQWGDGLFQTGLAGAVVFNPERAVSPPEIAAGFVVLLLPYSIIGPFAGALLDRWDRRRVLVAANILRGILILISAAAVATGVGGFPILLLALVVIGISRFVGAGLSASLPHVVPVPNLVEANALSVTLGAVISVIGGGCAVGLRAVFGDDNVGSGLTTAVAVIGSGLAAWLAGRFARGALGPDKVVEPATALAAVANGLFDGGRVAARTPSVAAGFCALLAHRASFGISLLLTVILMRYSFEDWGPVKAGLPGLGVVLGAGGLGIFVAGLTTARLVTGLGRKRTVFFALGAAALSQFGLGLPMTLPTTLLAAFLIAYTGQVVKLCVDAAVQRDIGDETRGRVFALYDMLFNITQALAVAIAATVIPANGESVGLIIAATLIYLAGITGLEVVSRRSA
ncbi:MFS transporter [Actinophytocola oryzae]|uniref:Putative MFS family arabinose efflux permease n=1 Tax=Actinophytocola oryzae TaxID=502181 RepID=A0A4R7VMR4_9PSEU|nr:MFS transporter [Actinophytocola oryzae]TDV50802.1 putative MFS family arabinose efflux permease [Actinophytocola oryzae]